MSLLNATVGPYRLDAFLGAGGMGEVYRAVHTTLGRVVAVKVLSPGDPAGARRFQNEARIQAGLRHPGIATLYEFLEYQGRPCIVMEYVGGETLAERLAARGPMPEPEAMAVFRKVVDAVAYLHRQGVIHRDLKSNNIKITPAGEVRILDFGIAQSKVSARLTQIGRVIGTPEYLAPELLAGRPADTRSDVWALGVLLREMLGRDNAVVARCLRLDPDQRYQSASEIRGLALQKVRKAGILAAVLVLLAVAAAFAVRRAAGPPPGDVAEAITVDVVGGSAEVWRGGARVGKTPFQVRARTGDRVDLLLKRDEYQDLPVQFDVTERKAYSYTMERGR